VGNGSTLVHADAMQLEKDQARLPRRIPHAATRPARLHPCDSAHPAVRASSRTASGPARGRTGRQRQVLLRARGPVAQGLQGRLDEARQSRAQLVSRLADQRVALDVRLPQHGHQPVRTHFAEPMLMPLRFLLCKHLVQLWCKPPTRFFHTVIRQGTTPFIKSEHLKLKPAEELHALGYRLNHYTSVQRDASTVTPEDDGDAHEPFAQHDDASDIFDGADRLEDDDDDGDEVEDERVKLRNARVREALGDPMDELETEAAAKERRAQARAKLQSAIDELDQLSRRFTSQLQFGSARFAEQAVAKTATARRFNADLASLDRAMTSTDSARPRTWAGPSGTMFYRPAQQPQ
jgi:hypothetical protein